MSTTIPKGSTVLVTGANGFIASHVVDQLLAAGYLVRGTVRSTSKADWLYKHFDQAYGKGKLQCIEVPDMVQEGAFDKAVEGVSGVVHLASILTFSNKPDEVIPPTVKGAINIITSASKEPSVKSLVYTSSSTATYMSQANKVMSVTKDTWNDAAVKAAYEPNAHSYVVYGASKTEAERAIWRATEESKPHFQVSAVLPSANFGPILQPGAENSSSTATLIHSLWNGADLYGMDPQYFVDVRDTAQLHVAALVDPTCDGQRIFSFAEPYRWNDILAIMRKQNPERKFRDDNEKEGAELCKVPNAEAEELLKKHYGHGWIGLEESIKANTATFKA